MTDINKVKDLIQYLAGSTDVSGGFLAGDWSIDYDLDLDKELSKELAGLQIEFDLLKSAIKENDLVTAKCALVMARLHSLNLSNFFMDIFEDIEKVGWSEGAKLPDVPEGYKIPEHYNYPKR